MLCVTRRAGGWVDIRDTRTQELVCSVYVLEIVGRDVRLGFKGPQHIQFLRNDARHRERKPDQPQQEMDHGSEKVSTDA